VSSNSPRAMKQQISKALVPALATGLLVLAGCGSSSSSSSSSSTETTASSPATSTSTSSSTTAPATGGASTLSVAANPEGQLSFEPTSLTAKAGKVSIDFTNKSALGHNLTVESSAGAVVGATPTFEGSSKTLEVTLKAGSYKFYCSVPGHRQGGMEGTITVQ
jgi:plastocyanin